MVAKVVKAASGTTVVLPQEVFDALHLADGADVSIEVDVVHGRIVIAPAAAVEADGVDIEFAQQVAEFIAEYRPALEALAR